MENFTPNYIFTTILGQSKPAASAWVKGNDTHPLLSGLVCFYHTPYGGVLINAEIYGLPDKNDTASAHIDDKTSANNTVFSGFYGMHIHEFGDCTQPFDKTGNHYNPSNFAHPAHAGDLLPLLSNNGYAWIAFYDRRFRINDILGRSVVIHNMRDDFTSQPAGNSGEKIGCGVIRVGLPRM